MADMRDINPWPWQDQYNFSQAKEVKGAQRVLHCAGQTSVDENGEPLHAGSMAEQMDQALDNLEVVLREAGLTLADVVQLKYYVTDIDAFMEAAASFGPRLAAARCKPASTLLKVAGLFHPDLMVEIEATAVE